MKQAFRQPRSRLLIRLGVSLSLLLLITFSACSHSKSHRSQTIDAPSSNDTVDVAPPSKVFGVELSSPKVPNGSVLRLDVYEAPSDTVIVVGKFENESIPFFKDKKLNRWTGFLPTSFYQKSGKYKIEVAVRKKASPEPIVFIRDIEITEGVYPSETLKVAQKHVSPGKKDLIRIKKEGAEIRAIYDQSTNEQLWRGEFILPVDTVVTSPYGVKRVYNGKLQNFHQGLDFRAPTGTPIMSPGEGRVVLAKNLFYTGNTVIIDHGFSIYTVYAHMSELKVRTGDKVSAKDLLGLSGSTGRVTGPHLHWGAVIRNVKVNPVDLMRVLK